MLSRTPERKMRLVRSGLLLGWFILILSLIWDPLTPAFTAPENQGSPFRLLGVPVIVQGHPLSLQPYPMGSRIFWTILLPLLPLILMLFGHETWRRICPLSHFSQIPHMLGWQRKVKKLNRNTGRVRARIGFRPRLMAASKSFVFSVWLPDIRIAGTNPVLQFRSASARLRLCVHHDVRTDYWIDVWRQDLVQLFLPDFSDSRHLHRSGRPARFQKSPCFCSSDWSIGMPCSLPPKR